MTRPYIRVNVRPDTDGWLDERRKSIGASEVPAALGLSPYGGTPRKVYLSKLGIDEPFDPLLSFIGHASEAIIHEWLRGFAIDEYPAHADAIRALDKGFMARARSHPFIHASFDRVSRLDGELIPWQFKTASAYVGHNWKERPPLDVEAQVQAEMFVAGAPYCFVVVWIGGRKFELFTVTRNQEWIDTYMLPRLTELWQNVTDRVEPRPLTIREQQMVWPSKDDTPLEGSEAVFEAVDMRDVLLADRKAIEDQLTPLEVAIADYMEDHDVLTRNGQPILSYKSQSGRRNANLNQLADDYPEAYAATVTTGNSFKVFRRIKPKEKK